MVHNWTLLNLFLHLAACQSVTMPALLPPSAQQSAKNKLQNRLNLINRTTLIKKKSVHCRSCNSGRSFIK